MTDLDRATYLESLIAQLKPNDCTKRHLFLYPRHLDLWPLEGLSTFLEKQIEIPWFLTEILFARGQFAKGGMKAMSKEEFVAILQEILALIREEDNGLLAET